MNLRHGHTFLGGLAAGVALDVHAFYLFGAGVLLGAGLVLVWGRLAGLLRWARRQASRPGFGSGSSKVW